MKRITLAALALGLAGACGSEAPPVEVAPRAGLLVAADPKLPGFDGWPLAFDVVTHGRKDLVCRLDVGGAVLETPVTEETCAFLWDGAGAKPGPLVASLVVARGEEVLAGAELPLEVVRVGVTSVDLVGGEGDAVSLLYSETGGVPEGFWETPADRPWRMADIDGQAPSVWTDVKSPPVDENGEPDLATVSLPTAWVAGAVLDATATFDGRIDAAKIRVVAPPGTQVVGDGLVTPGAAVTVTSDGSPVPAVGRYDVELLWRFEAQGPEGTWVPMPGALATEHRLYGLVAQPVFDYDGLPHRAWVEVVDTVTGWVDGATADPALVGAAIVEGVYYDLGLRYDRSRGASAYTYYLSGWNEAQFEIVAFQRRAYGEIINCSDAASIVSSYANMMGVDFRYHILERPSGERFDLNYILAIGWDEFDETPFFSGRGAFRYHAVVGPPDGTFYDATLALDGDGAPEAPPHEVLLAQGLDPVVYLMALSSEWDLVETLIDEKVRLR